jgi:PKD repeat protein
MFAPHRRFIVRPLVLLAALALAGACETPFAPSTSPTLAPSAPRYATVPAQGSSASLDFATWNLNWFGDAANGPTNEALQQSNVRDVIAGADADIWALEEVVGKPAFDSLVARLPGYTGVLANDPSVVNGPQYYSDFNNTEQKVALVYKTSIATLRSARIILTANDYDFAGRPPMEVKLTVTLNGVSEDLVVIVLHMKAGADAASWQRRQNAGIALKNYLTSTYPTQKVIVLGDWNDDVDTSILAGSPTPYANFVADSANYRFPTKVLSDSGLTSEVNYTGSVIDQHLVTNDLLTDYIFGSSKIFRADQYIASYGTTTTDHYPVLTRYTVPAGGTPTNAPPTASFTSSCTDLACTFTDASTDADGTVTAWSWSFGDGTTSSVRSPSHTYAAAGTYTVTLTATDNLGASSSTTRSVNVTALASGITLATRGYKVNKSARVDLTWSGAVGSTVDVFRNGTRVVSPSNTGAYTDVLGRVTGTFTYKVCNAGTTACSPTSSVTF